MIPESVHNVFANIEMPLVTVLADMERIGVLIDATTLNQHGERLKERIKTLEEEALHLAGKPFNLNSPKQLQEILLIRINCLLLPKHLLGNHQQQNQYYKN